MRPAALGAAGRCVAAVAARASDGGPGSLGDRQGHQLQSKLLARAHALPRRWHTAYRQQRGGEPHSPDRAATLKLVVRRIAAGQQAATVMSLIQSARLNGHDAYRYMRDVL